MSRAACLALLLMLAGCPAPSFKAYDGPEVGKGALGTIVHGHHVNI